MNKIDLSNWKFWVAVVLVVGCIVGSILTCTLPAIAIKVVAIVGFIVVAISIVIKILFIK